MILVKNLDKEIIEIRIDFIYILILNYGSKRVIDPMKNLLNKSEKYTVLDDAQDFLLIIYI